MKEKTLIKYIRKSKTVMVPVDLERFVGAGQVVGEQDMVNTVKRNLGRVYAKKVVSYPRGVLVCVCRDRALYIGWSYISNMAREEVRVGEHSFRVPSFVKKTAVKIAMDKINSRTKLWIRADMPIAVRKEFEAFAVRATKYFKTYKFGNIDITVAEERSDNEESVEAASS
jgi:hypothetical protein